MRTVAALAAFSLGAGLACAQYFPPAGATSCSITGASWLTCNLNGGVLTIGSATGQTAHQVLGTGPGSSFGPISLTTSDLPPTVAYTGVDINSSNQVVGLNGTLLSGLNSGLLCNTALTGVPSICVDGTNYVSPTTLDNNTLPGAFTSVTIGTGPSGCGSVAGCQAMTESTCAITPTSGVDIRCANSTTHTFSRSYNGGAITRDPGGVASITSTVSTGGGSTNHQVISYSVPANSVQAGTTYRINFSGTATSTTTSTTANLKVYFGPNNSTSDTLLATISNTTPTTAGSAPFRGSFDITFQSTTVAEVGGCSNNVTVNSTGLSTQALTCATLTNTTGLTTTSAEYLHFDMITATGADETVAVAICTVELVVP